MMSNELSSKIARVQELVVELNRHCHLYYNENQPEISDTEFDKLFDELAGLEKETGLIMSNSPTQTVGAAVMGSLAKVQHDIPLLSLDKTKDTAVIKEFIGDRTALLMLKLDGLTVKLEYNNGELQRASTRGDGNEGEDITHNARTFIGVPLNIHHKGYLAIVGEAYILESDFVYLQNALTGKDGKSYKNSRNLAAGSARLLDAGECAKRRIRFSAFGVQDGKSLEGVSLGGNDVDIDSKSSLLFGLQSLGFDVVRYALEVERCGNIDRPISVLRSYAEQAGIPIDGLVVTFDNVTFSKSLGRTGHHYRDGLALKFADEMAETVLRDVEWNVSRTGELSPVAVFDPVELDSTDVSRATLHNAKFIDDLKLKIGDRITVCKRNMIIPHVEANLDCDKPLKSPEQAPIPSICPCCESKLEMVANEDGDPALFCVNPLCFDRSLRQFEHFVSKKAMDITGLSLSTLRKFMEAGLIRNKADIFSLRLHKDTIVLMDGFGERAFLKLMDAIEESRHTTTERFIIAMDIPNLGRHASAILCKEFGYDLNRIWIVATSGFDFTLLDDFGKTLNQNIHAWFAREENRVQWKQIEGFLTFKTPKSQTSPAAMADSPFIGKTIVATGSFANYTRESINLQIEALGAKAGNSVSKKTDYVIVGEKAGSKKKKAESLGIKILTEAEFRSLAGL